MAAVLSVLASRGGRLVTRVEIPVAAVLSVLASRGGCLVTRVEITCGSSPVSASQPRWTSCNSC